MWRKSFIILVKIDVDWVKLLCFKEFDYKVKKLISFFRIKFILN